MSAIVRSKKLLQGKGLSTYAGIGVFQRNLMVGAAREKYEQEPDGVFAEHTEHAGYGARGNAERSKGDSSHGRPPRTLPQHHKFARRCASWCRRIPPWARPRRGNGVPMRVRDVL